MSRHKILIVNYDFPPALAGVRRVVKFAKYLPEFGYEPIVLAATPPPGSVLDMETARSVEREGYRIYRTPSLDPDHVRGVLRELPRQVAALAARFDEGRRARHAAIEEDAHPPLPSDGIGRALGWQRLAKKFARQCRRWLYLPDDRVGWVPFAYHQAMRILDSQPVRYVLTSSYPNSTHLIGLALARRYKVFWIADFRDGWTTNPYFADYPSPLHRWLNARWEARVAQRADLILSVSAPIAEHLRSLTDRPERVCVLPNGFDADDFEDLPSVASDRFTLVYTGTLFGQRSPEPLFAAMRILFDKFPALQHEMRAVFLTQWQPEHLAMIERYGLRDNVINVGLQPYRLALAYQRQADVLIAIEGEAPHGQMMLTQKIFEYLACGKPILAISPENALARVVRETRAGCVVAPDNIEELVARLYELFTGTFDFAPRKEVIARYARRTQVARLAQLLASLERGEIGRSGAEEQGGE